MNMNKLYAVVGSVTLILWIMFIFNPGVAGLGLITGMGIGLCCGRLIAQGFLNN